MRTEFKIDFSDFQRRMRKLSREVMPEAAEAGVARAGLQLLNDSVMERPTVPIREGWLRGSGSVFVQNSLIAVSSYGKPGKANLDLSEYIPPDMIVAYVGFNTPYAARLHESMDFHFREPSSGPKFLESKLLRNKEAYGEIIANTIKERLS